MFGRCRSQAAPPIRRRSLSSQGRNEKQPAKHHLACDILHGEMPQSYKQRFCWKIFPVPRVQWYTPRLVAQQWAPCFPRMMRLHITWNLIQVTDRSREQGRAQGPAGGPLLIAPIMHPPGQTIHQPLFPCTLHPLHPQPQVKATAGGSGGPEHELQESGGWSSGEGKSRRSWGGAVRSRRSPERMG